MSEPNVPEQPLLVSAPADGIPAVVNSAQQLAAAQQALASGHGPLAVDTERAQSFRYSAKAYLIQVRRAGAGTLLLDPVAFEGGAERADLSGLAHALNGAEWLLHAAQQDLPCLAEVGFLPRSLFDTELAGRLLGLPRVSLTSLTERALGKTLAKEHSAADWSRRPLPEDWLSYAALDVELLADLRDWIAGELETAGKTEWARQEFAFLVEHADDPVVARVDPWRRTSGLHDLRRPDQLSVVRALWHARDDLARRLDRAPGRVLPDRAITDVAGRVDASRRRLGREDVRAVQGFGWRIASRYESTFLAALDAAASETREDWPPMKLAPDGPPATPRTWAKHFPERYERWSRLRPAVVELAERWVLPVENLISPDAVRRLAWEPPEERSEQAVDAFLAGRLVRPWQRELVVPVVTALLDDPS